jgi:hypothetical protein
LGAGIRTLDRSEVRKAQRGQQVDWKRHFLREDLTGNTCSFSGRNCANSWSVVSYQFSKTISV